MTGTRPLLVAVALILLLPSAARAACVPGPSNLCLQEQRFQISVDWRSSSGQSGRGTAVALTSDTGYFWFFSPANLELMVKVLDGRSVNGHFWLFYGALSDVAYTVTVRDTATGETKVYTNPSGRLASVADTSAFAAPPVAGAPASASTLPRRPEPVSPAVTASCVPTQTSLCLNNGRFRVSVLWRDFQGRTGRGQAVSLTGDTGYFWFFSPSNVELVLKILDGRGANSSFWLFYGALSSVEYIVEVTDTVTGVQKAYHNVSGNLASFADTSALQDTLDAGAQAAASYDRFLKALDDQILPGLSPETAPLFFGLVDPVKELFQCLRRAALSPLGAVCRGFDQQQAAYRDVWISPEEARWAASLVALDAGLMERQRSAAPAASGGSLAHGASSQLPACGLSTEAAAAGYLGCELLRWDVLSVVGSLIHWGCLKIPGAPIPRAACYALLAADIGLGVLKVIVCNTTPLYMTKLFVAPTEPIELGFDDSRSFEIVGDFESRPEASSVYELVQSIVAGVFAILRIDPVLAADALGPITDAVVARLLDAHVRLEKTECTAPVSALVATAEADVVTGGGVSLEGRTIRSRQQEAFGYIRPKIRPLAPWGYITGTSTAFKVDRKHCTGSGRYRLETFRFPTSGGPAELSYTWYRTHTTCNGATTSHEILPVTDRFFYPGEALPPSCPIYRCDGKWVSYHFSDSRAECQWTPENPYLCTLENDWSVDFADGVVTTRSSTTGTGHWASGRVIAIDSQGESRYDLSTGVYSGSSASEWIYSNEISGCLDWISDLHGGFNYILPAEEPTCRMVDRCP